MKSDSIGLRFKTETQETVASILYAIVIEIRKELAKNYNVYRGDNENYTGLCDFAVELLHRKLEKFSEENNIIVKCNAIHGEQKHTWRIHSDLWPYQHTWAVVEMMGVKMYVDPTCGQFKRMYFFIPDYYISIRKPKWFYPDRNNPAYCFKSTRWLNDHIKIPITISLSNGNIHKGRAGLIEFIQYEIWGRICDSMRKQERPLVRRL